MKEDNISQLGHYDVPFNEQHYTHGSCCISLFKFKSFDQFNTLQIASNFRHLLSCGTIVAHQVYCICIKIIRQSVLNMMNREEARRIKKTCHDFRLLISM